MATILVVDDDRAIRDVVCFALTRAGFEVQQAADGAAALRQFRAAPADLIVLDVLMPELDGTDVCRTLRRTSSVPILFLSSKDDEIDRVVGLEVGGDDYLVKPFNPRELVARVRTVLRRAGGSAPGAAPVLSTGRLRADVGQRRVWVDAQEIALTATEFDLLIHLMRHPERVFDRQSLLSAVWGYAAASGLRTVDVHIAALRAKLGDASPIRTVRGVGYAVAAG